MDIVSALRSFLRVAETGSFSAAAADLGVTQPAVSRQVSALESHLTIRLLHRTTSGLALTAEGERAIPFALRVLAAVDELGDAAGLGCAAASGKVRLSVPGPLGMYLGGLLAPFLAAYPGLSVELVLRENPSDLLEEGIDLEVRLGPVLANGLICRHIGWTTAFLVAAPSYLSRSAAPSAPAELQHHECLYYNRGGEGMTWYFSDGSAETAVRVAPRLISNNALAVYRAALSGAGLAILSHLVAGPDIATGRLIAVMPGFPPSRLPMHVVYLSRRNIPLRVKAVLDFLMTAVGADPAMSR
ncbi:LysR family transcriptional regulator [Sodalis sp. RH19]|uniref:LysR family transcriptional regulator n=1 Tax=Sodalis sp. RH19 TaxID=3394334 RepID=UPI0039B5929D